MIAIDTNILVYAHRSGAPEHERSLAWLRHFAEGRLPWGLPVFCLGEFMRVATHPRVLDPPSTVAEAIAALDGLLASPSVRVLSPGPRFPEIYFETVRAGDARGNLTFDAQIAAVCLEHGADRLLTLDRDFARFPTPELVPFDDGP